MSLRQNGNDLGSTKASVRTFDLSVDRSSPDDYELLRFPNARTVSPINVPAEAYFRFGSKTAPQVDLREFDGGIFEADEDQSLGAVYLENPSNSGTLELFIGTQIITTPSVSVDVSSGDVNVTDRDDRDLGDVEIATSGNDVNITDRDGRDLGDVEIQTSGNTVDVSDREAREAGKIRVQDSGGTLIDPPEATTTTASTSSTGSANAAEVQAANGRTAVSYMFDTSGSATVTVEESTDGSNWYQRTTESPGSAVTQSGGFTTGADHVRIHLNQNLNTAEISVKGA